MLYFKAVNYRKQHVGFLFVSSFVMWHGKRRDIYFNLLLLDYHISVYILNRRLLCYQLDIFE